MDTGGPERHEGPEGRRTPRLAVDLDARLGGRSPRLGRVVDLSLQGCLVRSEAPLVGGSVVDLRVELPDGALSVKACVAEASLDGDSLPGPPARFLSGLEFLGLSAADELRLRTFLEAESKRRRGAHSASP
jgi:hypothetical protein